jgi:hypothetical protein
MELVGFCTEYRRLCGCSGVVRTVYSKPGAATARTDERRASKCKETMDIAEIRLNSPTNRLIGDMPKIGIRPTIDGRRKGVRESLEEQAMSLAQAAARFLHENLRHANGLPVECVIADTCIGGVAEAAQCAEKFACEELPALQGWRHGASSRPLGHS